MKNKKESLFKKLFRAFTKPVDDEPKKVARGRYGRQFLRDQVRRSTAYQWGSMYKQRKDDRPILMSDIPQRGRNFRRSKYNGRGELV